MAHALVRIARPEQWAKNAFVLIPLVFGGKYSGRVVFDALWAVGCFCLLSSGVYCLNDVIDAPADRLHPRKKLRPVAAGNLSSAAAIGLGGLLVVTGLAAGFVLPGRFQAIALLYLLNNALYFFIFKHRVIVDVLVIANGFVLRILAGCAAMELRPSSWILVCGFSLAMLLGFGKRRLELGAIDISPEFRPALKVYTETKLDMLLAITSSLCLMSYMLYTVSPETIARHHTESLVYTVPVVAYGVFRYLFKVQEGGYDGPTELLVRDPVFGLTVLVWLGMVAFALFWPMVR